MVKLKNSLVMFVVLYLLWVLLSNSLDITTLITGFVIVFIMTLFIAPGLKVFAEIKLTPKALLNTVLYILVFLKEIILSNLDVAYRVVSPKLPINPGIVEARTTLKSPMARMVLANSITLTPGTFTVEMQEDTLFIHCIDIKSDNVMDVTNKVIRKFEKYLEVIYG